MKKVVVGLAIILGMGWSWEVGASLYCAVDFNGRRCQFVDLASCQMAIGPQGSCVLDRDSLVAPQGGAPFCLVEQWKTECIYQDLAACERMASPRKATCIGNPNSNRGVPTVSGGDGMEVPGGDSRNKRYLPSPDYFPAPGHR